MKCPSSMTELDKDIEEFGYGRYHFDKMPYSDDNYEIFRFIEHLHRNRDFKYDNCSKPEYGFNVLTNITSGKSYKIIIDGEYIMVRRYYNDYNEYKLIKRKKIIKNILNDN